MRRFALKASTFIQRVLLISLLGANWIANGPAHAYEEITVQNGATISGAVTLLGTAPSPFSFKVTMGAYPQHCEPIADKDGNVLLPRARVSKANEVQDVVVFLQRLKRGKAPAAQGPTLTVNRCQFDQLVMAGMDGSSLRMLMNDTVLHPLRGWEMLNEGRIPLFHFPNLETGEEKSTKLTTRRSGMVKVECDQHRFMQTWILVPLNPYFATTNEKGLFAIDQIPAGSYTLSAWHPALGYLEKSITLEDNQRKTLSFQYQPSSSNVQ